MPKRLHWYASIRELDIGSIHVPARFHANINGTDREHATYRVTLAYGKRYEPWVVAVDEE